MNISSVSNFLIFYTKERVGTLMNKYILDQYIILKICVTVLRLSTASFISGPTKFLETAFSEALLRELTWLCSLITAEK